MRQDACGAARNDGRNHPACEKKSTCQRILGGDIRVLNLKDQIETERVSGDCHRPLEQHGEYDDRSHGHKKHDRQVSFIVLAARVDADQRDRK
ncbi:hypothetical protein D9M69_561740 [compost metagenome]